MVFLDTECLDDSWECSLTLTYKNILVLASRKVFYNRKLIALFWLTNAILAFILSLPLYHLLTEQLSHSLTSNLLNSHFDYLWLIQFQNIYSVTLSEIPFMTYSVVGVYTLVQTFYLGGLISVFNYPQKNHISDFFYGSVRYWIRFFKILLFTIFSFALLFGLNDLLGTLIQYISGNSANNWFDFILRAVRYGILLFLIGIITIISDYSKVLIAVRDEVVVSKSIFQAIIFIKNNFILTFSVFLFISLLGAFGSIMYNLFEVLIPRTPYYFLALAFVLQQLLVIFRLFIKMYFCSTEVIIYKDLSAHTIKMKEATEMEVV